jgi:hypothetical protein
MGAEAAAGLNNILVDHPQIAKMNVERVMIFTKGKRVATIQPVNPGMATG